MLRVDNIVDYFKDDLVFNIYIDCSINSDYDIDNSKKYDFMLSKKQVLSKYSHFYIFELSSHYYDDGHEHHDMIELSVTKKSDNNLIHL